MTKEERIEKAVDIFTTNGFNCSQAILCAFCDLYGLDEVTAFKLAEGFGLGMSGYMDECGAVTGMFMTLGLDNSDGKLTEGSTKLDTYARVKEAGESFAEKRGSIMCGELLKQEKELRANATEEQLKEAGPKKLICVQCVRTAAEYLAENLRAE